MIDLLETLLGGLFGPLVPYLQAVKPYVPFIMIGLVILASVVRYGTPFVLALVRRLVTRTPRALFKAKAELLTNDAICEMYAPANQYVTDREEGKRGHAQFAWLSPFPRAVKASIKRNPVSRNKKFNARAQVAAAAKCIKVRAPHPADNVAGDLDKHYRIDMKLDGNDEEQLKRMAGRIESQLGLHSVEVITTSDNYTLNVIAHKEEPVDILTERKAGVEFFKENPAKTPYQCALAFTETGAVWQSPLHHTLINGASGSGKGAYIQGTIYQYSPFVAQGLVEFHGIDPKKAELKAYEYFKSSIFKRITSGLKDDDMREHGDHIAEIIDILDYRMNNLKVSVDEGNVNLQRDLPATKENPMVILIIDEYLTLYRGLKKLGREGATHLSNIEQLIATGRSYGVYIVAATQRADKEVLGEIRDNISNVVLLRQKSPYINDLFLGDDAKARGFDSTAIPTSTKSNGYATAGIGYVQEESGDPVKVRFAYLGDDDLARLIRDFEREHGRGDIEADQLEDFREIMERPDESDDFLYNEDGAQSTPGNLPQLDGLGSLPDLNDDEEVNV